MKGAPHIILGLWLAGLASPAAAERLVSMRFEHAQTLPFEAVHVFITLDNDSNYPLIIGPRYPDANAEVHFLVRRDRSREDVPRRREGSLWERLVLNPGERREVSVDLSSWYDLSREGRYVVRLVVDWHGQRFSSRDMLLDVVNGIEIDKVVREVPDHWERLRRYSLRYWPRNGSECLFLCVDEPETQTNYGVFALGRLVRVFRPRLSIDRFGKVMIVHQSAFDRYTRTIFESSATGIRFVDQTYHLPDGQPLPSLSDDEEEIEAVDIRQSPLLTDTNRVDGSSGPILLRPFKAVGRIFHGEP